MSHSVTIRTHTVTSGSPALVVNTGYMKTWSGLLKILQLALGIVCVGIVGNKINRYNGFNTSEEMFFLLMTTTFLIGTFIFLVSCLASLSTASIISKTIYDLLYHSFGFALLLAASLTLLVHVSNNYKYQRDYELMLGASICGLVNAALYVLNTIIAVRSYRGL